MPLGPEYDKMIDSKFADMKNTGGRYGGSITAAQFLQRFVDKTPWAHLDIAGTAHGLAADRHQQELGLGLGRAAARPAGGGSLREVTRERSDDRDPVLPPATPAARTACCRRCWRNRSSAAGASWCRRRPRSASRRSTRICGPIATTASCRTAPRARPRPREQPILLTIDDDNPNGATVRFLIDGAPVPADAASLRAHRAAVRRRG